MQRTFALAALAALLVLGSFVDLGVTGNPGRRVPGPREALILGPACSTDSDCGVCDRCLFGKCVAHPCG